MSLTSPNADITKVRRMLRDEDLDTKLLDDENIDEAIQAAVERYSQVVPGESVVDITGNGTSFYNISNLTGFIEGWSYITEIEYPAGDVGAGHYPEFLDETSDWRFYRDDSNTYLWFPNHSPSASEEARVTFTIPRVLTEVSDTIVTEHKDALRALAAGYCCDILAAKNSSVSAPLIGADVVNWQMAQRRYQAVGDTFKSRFDERIGLGAKKTVKSAGVRHDWDVRGTARGLRPRLTHWGRT